MRRFWTMLAHCHGNRWNAAELSRSLGVSAPTVSSHLGALVVRRVTPWSENLRKRQVKAPEVYVTDTGLLHALLGSRSESALLGHPKCGASWEGFAMREAVRILSAAWEDCHYWATHRGTEIDLTVNDGNRRLGLEFKRTSAPKMTRSIQSALADLHFDRVIVLFPGDTRFQLHERVEAVGLTLACSQGLL